MILPDELIEIGRFLKPHGYAGEITFALEYDLELNDLKCLVTDIDGIFVPFFIDKIRTKGQNALLLTIDGLNNDNEVAILNNKIAYALKEDVDITVDETQRDGFTAYDFVGYTMLDTDKNDSPIGTIDFIDDATENFLFMVEPFNTDTTRKTRHIAIPVADEFITDIDTENHTISVSLPQGLLEM